MGVKKKGPNFKTIESFLLWRGQDSNLRPPAGG